MIFANTAISRARFASVGRETNRVQVKAIPDQLDLGDCPPEPFTERLFDGKLTIECDPAELGRVKLVGRAT